MFYLFISMAIFWRNSKKKLGLGVPKKIWGLKKKHVWGGVNERPESDHVTSGPMKGLEKNSTRWCTQTEKQTDKQT